MKNSRLGTFTALILLAAGLAVSNSADAAEPVSYYYLKASAGYWLDGVDQKTTAAMQWVRQENAVNYDGKIPFSFTAGKAWAWRAEGSNVEYVADAFYRHDSNVDEGCPLDCGPSEERAVNGLFLGGEVRFY